MSNTRNGLISAETVRQRHRQCPKRVVKLHAAKVQEGHCVEVLARRTLVSVLFRSKRWRSTARSSQGIRGKPKTRIGGFASLLYLLGLKAEVSRRFC